MHLRIAGLRELLTTHTAAADALIVVGLLAVGLSVGSFVCRQYVREPRFYQNEFGPAVMVAAGRGFVNPVAAPGSPLGEFLALKRPALGVADVSGVATQPLNQFQYGSRYMIAALGYAWKISGISWAAVSSLAAPLYALSLVACYAFCRLWLPRGLSLVGALFTGFSPVHLEQVPQLRDYSKAPFILWAMVLVACVAARPLPRWRLALLSAACGAIVGIGLGFRMDVVIMAPLFLASLIVFHDRRPWTRLGGKALAAGAFVLALALAAAPVLVRLSTGGTNGFHVILLGYSDEFDDALGVNRTAYSLLPFYNDSYVNAVVQTYDGRTSDRHLSIPSPAYDAASRAYWLTLVRHFPADVLTRALAAAKGILNMPVSQPPLDFLAVPAGNTAWTLLAGQRPRLLRIGVLYEWLVAVNGWGVVFGAVLIAAASVTSRKLGLFAATTLFVLSGYLSLQFARRHYFQLEIVPVLGLLVTIRLIVVAFARPPGWQVVRRFAASIVVLVLALGTSVVAVRAFQRMHLRRVFQQYVDAPKESVQAVLADEGGGLWRASWNATPARPLLQGSLRADYYVVEFDGAPLLEMSVFGVHYKASSPDNHFGRIVAMSGSQGVNRVFVPAYGEPPLWEIDSFEFPVGIRNRLRGIYRVSHPERLPMLLDLRLSGDWRRGSLGQTLRLEGDGWPDGIQVLGDSVDKVSPVAVIGRIESSGARPNPADVRQFHKNVLRVTRDGIEVDGPAESQSSYLLSLKPVHVEAPAALLVAGHLETGGLVVGLLEDDHWYRQQFTGLPGDFVAVIDITKSGTYTPIVTNATARDRDRNRFVLSRFGIVSADPGRP
jgi:hypothetical protein